MAELKLYNTLTRKKEPFVPLDASNLRMYVCGPTVYDFAHIGNARPVIVFDVLFRLLRHLAKQGVWDGGKGETKVTYARNITDVDDKINDRAARDFPDLPLNEAIRRVTEGTNAQFQADVTALGCLQPTAQPRATEHLDEMRGIIERLVAKGFAYVAEEHVLFSPEAMNQSKGKLPAYGSLANRSLDEMIAGARVDVAPYKRGATDFVLWKPSDAGQPGWPSPCGIKTDGRPGWHIECSAMSMAKLLAPFGGGLTCDDPLRNTFDIHGGGIDLVFPHHENEIAQSCCAFGSARMANIWMHNGFLQVEGQKMSKSLGNFTTIADVLKDWPGEVARLTMLKTHYRQPIDWTVKSLEESQQELDRFAEITRDVSHWLRNRADYENQPNQIPYPPEEPSNEISSALSDDLNTAEAMRVLRSHYKAATVPSSSAKENAGRQDAAIQLWLDMALLGFDLNSYRAARRASERTTLPSKADIQSLITARLAARNAKNFAESDRIRDELTAMGIQIMDAKDPVTGELKTTWEVKR